MEYGITSATLENACMWQKKNTMSRTPRITLSAEAQTLAAGMVLARAFFNDPLCVYTQPDLEARMSQFTWFFTQLVRKGAMEGGVYTDTSAGQPKGVAVWVPPHGGEPTADVAAGTEIEQMEKHFGPEAYRRFTNAYRHFDQIHHQCMEGPHWYLALLGVSPRCQRQGIGRALLTPVLNRADQDGLPCYLETFVSDNVPFYEHRGFQVVDAGVEPHSQIAFWAMKREPLSHTLGE
jgi:GNAT superfamily N-acetyltransferase